jgi:hypothetical protein
MERILAQNLLVRRGDRSRLYRLIIPYIIWESHPFRHIWRMMKKEFGAANSKVANAEGASP